MAKPEQINIDNYLSVDLQEVVRDQRFKDLNFNPLREKLSRIQKWFKELETYEYGTILSRVELQRIDSLRNDFIHQLQQLNTFEIRTTNDTKQYELDNETNRVESLYDEASQNLTRILTFLRQETASVSQDVDELQRQQKAAAEAEIRYREIYETLQEQLKQLQATKEEVAETKGEVTAITLGKHFEEQAFIYNTKSTGWLGQRNLYFWSLFIVILGNILLYIFLKVMYSLYEWPKANPENFFTLEYGIAKIAFLALLSYAISFASRNYNICAGLTATNLHRKNVAETLLNALGSPMKEDQKAALMNTAADAMFRHLPIGYIRKETQSDSGPIGEFFRRLSGSKD